LKKCKEENIMTSKQRKEAFNLLEDGRNWQETADAVGVTRDEIAMTFGAMFPDKKRRAKHGGAYPNIHAWKLRNGVNNDDLAAMSGISHATVSKYLRGDDCATKNFIDFILELTGMTYEECFAKEKAPEDAATSIKG
jgi:hypothetical protein